MSAVDGSDLDAVAGAGPVPVLVVVPPNGAAWSAARLLGIPLLDRAVAAVRAAGLGPVEVVDGDLVAALRERREEFVLVHDALHPLVPPGLAAAVLAALTTSGAAGAVPVHPVTDTLKLVDPGGDVQGTADRSGFRVAASPQAYRRAELVHALDALGDHGPGVLDLPGLVLAAGGRLATLQAPAQALHVATPEALLLAEALLDVGAGVPGSPDDAAGRTGHSGQA